MPKISDIEDKGKRGLDISRLSWLKRAVGSDLIKGGVYLLAGEPGIGKTTLSLQVLGKLTSQGINVLFLPTEQSMSDIKRVFARLFKSDIGQQSMTEEHLYVDTIDDLKMLPWFLSHQILPLVWGTLLPYGLAIGEGGEVVSGHAEAAATGLAWDPVPRAAR